MHLPRLTNLLATALLISSLTIIFRMPALYIAEYLVKNGNQVWHYNFSWFSPAFDGKLGAAHFVDVPFIFNTLDSEQAKSFVGNQLPQKLANTIHQNRIEFAHYGKVS